MNENTSDFVYIQYLIALKKEIDTRITERMVNITNKEEKIFIGMLLKSDN